MKRTLINFATTAEKKEQYTQAAKTLGVSVSVICRKALDNAVLLTKTLETPKPEVAHDYP